MSKMMNRSVVVGFGCALALSSLVGCAKSDAPSSPKPAPVQGADAKNARPAPGDFGPVRLYARPTPDFAGLGSTDPISLSTARSPKTTVAYPQKAETVHVRETFLFVDPGASTSSLTIPVDAPDGATIHVLPKSADAAVARATLRDVSIYEPSGKTRVDQRAAKPTFDGAAGGKEAAPPLTTIALSPSMEAGAYQVKLGGVASKEGVAVHVQLPSSKIEMALTPSTTLALAGGSAHVAVNVLDDGAPISGATLQGNLVRPDGSMGPVVTFRETSPGTYDASVLDALTESDATGMWNVFVRAKGTTSSGVAYDRLGSIAFEYVVPTARIASASAPRLVKNGDQITEIDVDVSIESTSTDRYELDAVLAGVAPDGSERPLGEAQTAAVLDAGVHTITLKFEAGYLALSKLDGPYVVRAMTLFSQGRSANLQRLGYGLDLRTPELRATQLAPLAFVRPAIDEMVQNHEFDLQ